MKTIKIPWGWVAAIVLAFLLLLSCGAKKRAVNKEAVAVTSELKEAEQVRIQTSEVSFVDIIKDSDEFILTPVSNDKPIIWVSLSKDTTTVYNAKIERKKSRIEAKGETTKESITDIDRVTEAKQDITAEKKTVSVERKGWGVIQYIGLGLTILIVTGGLYWFFVYRKKRES